MRHAISSGFRYLVLLILCGSLSANAADFFVATSGDDGNGDGSSQSPWATITHALRTVTDGSTIIVRPGTYSGRVRLEGQFSQGVLVKSEIPYMALLRNNDRVITAYGSGSPVGHITIEGFDIAHDGPGAGALVVHLDGGGNMSVSDITLRNNVFHDSYNNDLLKINNAATGILVQGNMFYNQTGSDEHIDINSVADVTIEDNVFFNDFAGSGRTNGNNTGSYVVIKDSNGGQDALVGSRDITVRRNIFLNWEGSTGSYFLLVGEDGQPFHEAYDVTAENNLMIGNSGNVMRAAFGVKGARDVLFRYNTVAGDLPALAYAMRLNTEGSNPPNENIRLHGNVWSDPSGSMGAAAGGQANDFSDTPPGETLSFELRSNLYWNGGQPLPQDPAELVNVSDDPAAVTGDPLLGDQQGILAPRWDENSGMFAGGALTIREVFQQLVYAHGFPTAGSAVIGQGTAATAPLDDILGRPRTAAGHPDIGAVEVDAATGIGAANPDAAPDGFIVYQNYPNPFNPSTDIEYQLFTSGRVELTVFDITGQRVATLVEAFQSPGFYQVRFNSDHKDLGELSSGLYVYRLRFNNQRVFRRMILAR